MNEALKVKARLDLHIARDVVRRDQIPAEKRLAPAPGSWGIYLLFNILAAFDEGHAVLGVGPVDGKIMTYSYYRQGNKFEGPGLMACLRDPEAFEQLRRDHGWLIHGNPGNYWNEHMDCALALSCTAEAGQKVQAFAESVKQDRGTYDLVSNNCLTFVEHALAAGGIELLGKSGHKLHTFVPKDAFAEVDRVGGGDRMGAWKYWLGDTPAPKNGLRTIDDFADYELGE